MSTNEELLSVLLAQRNQPNHANRFIGGVVIGLVLLVGWWLVASGSFEIGTTPAPAPAVAPTAVVAQPAVQQRPRPAAGQPVPAAPAVVEQPVPTVITSPGEVSNGQIVEPTAAPVVEAPPAPAVIVRPTEINPQHLDTNPESSAKPSDDTRVNVSAPVEHSESTKPRSGK